jgi:hypothetical protein
VFAEIRILHSFVTGFTETLRAELDGLYRAPYALSNAIFTIISPSQQIP